MPWLQMTLTVKRDQVDAVSAQCDLLGALCVTLKDHADEPLFCENLGDQPLWQLTDIVALFDESQDMAPITQYFAAQSQITESALELIEDQDWVRVSLDSFEPMQFSNNFWVVPSWSAVPDPSARNLMLDPGLAFGTGSHETTRLCLSYLANTDLTDKVVVDYGCGSGILGLSALALGAREVWGIDNDPQAVLASQQNLALNPALNGKFYVGLPGEFPELALLQADIVVANILAGPLVDLAPIIGKLTKKGGILLLSGILSEQAAFVCSAYEQSHIFQELKEDSGWILCSLQKKR